MIQATLLPVMVPSFFNVVITGLIRGSARLHAREASKDHQDMENRFNAKDAMARKGREGAPIPSRPIASIASFALSETQCHRGETHLAAAAMAGAPAKAGMMSRAKRRMLSREPPK